MEKNSRTEMLPGKRDFYRCCKARRSASHVNKEFWLQFQNYAPPTLRVIRTKFARTIIYILEKWFPFQGERAHSLLLFLYMLIERRRRRGRQNNNNSLPKVVTFFTDYKYTTSP